MFNGSLQHFRNLKTLRGFFSSVRFISTTMDRKALTLETMNPHVRKMEYAVRGPILGKAQNIEKALSEGVKMNFESVIRANIGDCHACGQPPITFIRQVAALVAYPKLLDDPSFPSDAKDRAKRVLNGCRGGSIGSYSESAGVDNIRQDVAEYITQRDGTHLPQCDPANLVLSTGASGAIRILLQMLMTGEGGNSRAGVMIPIPQYPLYSATLAEYNAYQIPYYLNEEENWSLDVSELRRALNEAKPHCKPRALVVINPGNPTGQVLSGDNIRSIVKFAKDENLFILADEVYQHNVYEEGAEFVSFRKAVLSADAGYRDAELASFMSASKGYMGECGYRGGYMEVMNLDPEVHAQLMKACSVQLCPPVSGQTIIECVANPPRSSDPSFDNHQKEKNQVLEDLKLKAALVSDLFNSVPGIRCNPVQGAMYAFPQLLLPPRAIKAAQEKNLTPDSFYCFSLLEEAGICVVPGSGFGQSPETYHFRTTILPTVSDLKIMLARFKVFHLKFMEEWS